MAGVADGTVLYRSGTTIAGATLSGLTITAGVLTNDLISGKSGGLTAAGGVAAGEALTLVGSVHASGGVVNIAASRTIASGASATWNAIVLGSTSTATLSGSTNVTTAAGFNMISIPAPTITSGSALTVTSAATMTILGAPVAGGSTTITNAYALWVQAGATRLDGNIGVGIKPSNQLDLFNSSGGCTMTSKAGTTATGGTISARNSTGVELSMYCYGSAVAGSIFGVNNASLGLIYSGQTNLVIGVDGSGANIHLATGSTVKAKIPNAGGLVVGVAAIATNATDGFLYIPSCAGTPTGTPSTQTGTVPMVYDTTNHKLYIYDSGWKGGTAPGAWS
jgi:hypothetical protein